MVTIVHLHYDVITVIVVHYYSYMYIITFLQFIFLHYIITVTLLPYNSWL